MSNFRPSIFDFRFKRKIPRLAARDFLCKRRKPSSYFFTTGLAVDLIVVGFTAPGLVAAVLLLAGLAGVLLPLGGGCLPTGLLRIV